MTINRHNYEEYFLLYVDNELSLHQRMEVELFAEQNPDLQAELKMLQEATLSDIADDMVFPDKSSLLRHDEASVSINNHEEQFLLYIDNELNAKDKAAVETFVLQHPQLQTTFSLLKQAVLQPEEIAHPDKASLYRSAEERRVVPFRWVRFAAAAAVLGIAVTLWQVNSGDKPVEPKTAYVAPTIDKKDAKNPVVTTPAQTAQATEQGTRVQPENVAQVKRDVTNPVGSDNALVNGNARNEANNTPNTPEEPPKTSYIAANIVTNVSEPEKNNLVVTNMDAKPLETVKVEEKVLKVLDTNEDNNNGLYIGSLELNRNKVKGFLRKAGNLFSAKAKGPQEDKIQVANFEIKKNQQK
ncbi:MAG: hypothetical protein J0I41_16790 [Filimonas sp.]|nr:hypothetical protein [Filimonas sp.]